VCLFCETKLARAGGKAKEKSRERFPHFFLRV
jgi:hypothetical protein